MNELFEIPGMKNIGNDNIVKRSANAKVAKSTFDNEIQNEIIISMSKLKEQNTLLSSLQQNVTKPTIRNWNLLINCLPSNIFNFCRKALTFSLDNNSNLARSRIRHSLNCDLCGKTQTTASVQSTMVDTDGVTTLLLRRFCAIYVVQMSTKCLPVLKAIIVCCIFSFLYSRYSSY